MRTLESTLIYVASRASIPERSAMWRKLRDEQGWQITSSWIDEAGEGQTTSYSDLWRRIYREIFGSDGLILYAEQDDFPLKGALIEAGIAIGMDKPICVVLHNVKVEGRTMRPIGSWVAYPNVMTAPDMEQARNRIHYRLLMGGTK